MDNEPPTPPPPQNPQEHPISIQDEMRTSYLDYAMSVIIGRAIPDVRDGLKPVHRRILYAMRELKLHARYLVQEVRRASSARCSASTTRTATRACTTRWCAWRRTSRMRHLLVDGQGNFGSVDGDPAAAYRYTECRLVAHLDGAARRHRQGHRRLLAELRRVAARSRWSCRRASRTCWSTAPAASPSAWRPTSRRTTWARSSTPPSR